MYIHVTPKTIEREVNTGSIPVLLACLHPNADLIAQTAMLEAIANAYDRRVKVCLLCNELNGAVRHLYAIEGTPTYLLIADRRVRERVLGQTNEHALTRLLDRALDNNHQ